MIIIFEVILIYSYDLEQRSKSRNNQNNVSQPSVSNNTYGPPIQFNGNCFIIVN